jgi:hypothetical protein
VARVSLLVTACTGLLVLMPPRLAVPRDEDACATRVTTASPCVALVLMYGCFNKLPIPCTAGRQGMWHANGPMSGQVTHLIPGLHAKAEPVARH